MQREDVERLERTLRSHTGLDAFQMWAMRDEAANALRALLYRAERAEAERDEAFAAGQEEMRERAAEQCECALMDWEGDVLHDRAKAIRDLPIKLRPE